MPEINDDELLPVNSEVIWTFNDFKTQVIDEYPNGKAITEQLITVGGENTWKIEFYPNGKDAENQNKVCVVITYTQTNNKNVLVQTEAECNYRIINNDENKNYVGKIERQLFKSFVSAQDASFDVSILGDCIQSCLIGICISQYPVVEKNENLEQTEMVKKESEQLASAAVPDAVNVEDDLVKNEAQLLF